MINYVVKRKVMFYQYLINIGFITLGGFFMFTGIPMFDYFGLISAGSIMLIGLIYLLFGLAALIEQNKKAKPNTIPIQTSLTPIVEKPKPANGVKTESTLTKEKVEIKVDYSKMTLKELQVIAKNRNLSGISKLNKVELIELLNKKDK